MNNLNPIAHFYLQKNFSSLNGGQLLVSITLTTFGIIPNDNVNLLLYFLASDEV